MSSPRPKCASRADLPVQGVLGVHPKPGIAELVHGEVVVHAWIGRRGQDQAGRRQGGSRAGIAPAHSGLGSGTHGLQGSTELPGLLVEQGGCGSGRALVGIAAVGGVALPEADLDQDAGEHRTKEGLCDGICHLDPVSKSADLLCHMGLVPA